MDDTQLEDLNRRWAIAGRLDFVRDSNGLVFANISSDSCAAKMYLHGAHVSHFQPRGFQPLLFLSGASKFEPGAPIRGGIPICFPWFGAHETDPNCPAHGYARTSEWSVTSVKAVGNVTVVEMRLQTDEFFEDVSVIASFSEELRMEFRVTNTRDLAVRYELALHSYFQLSNVQEVSITGLEEAPFFDQLQEVDCPAAKQPIVFERETDRIYFDAPSRVVLRDPSAKRQIVVEREGAGSFVVWNPWVNKAKRMLDFGDDEWTTMCCIESSAVRRNAVKLPSGESTSMVAVHRVEPLE